jgi:hypothetical protein
MHYLGFSSACSDYLKVLLLPNNMIGDVGACELATALINASRALETFDLSGNIMVSNNCSLII